MKLRRLFNYGRLFIFLSCLLIVGCVPYMLSQSPKSSEAEDADVKTAVSPGITISDLQKIKKVAMILGTESKGQENQPYMAWFTGGDLTNIMADNIALELMNLGYQVVERSSLETVISEQRLQTSGILDPTTAAKVGKVLGVDAIVLGNVKSSQITQFGAFTGIKQEQVISHATMKVVSVERGIVVMMVSLSYKKGGGQPPTEASKTMAIALAKKLKNPF